MQFVKKTMGPPVVKAMNSNTLSDAYRDAITIAYRYIGSTSADTSFRFCGRHFETPIMAGPISFPKEKTENGVVANLAVKAKTAETKADREKAAFRQTVLETVADNGDAMRAGDVANALGVSTQKASAALNALVAEGALVKVDGEKRTVLFKVADAE